MFSKSITVLFLAMCLSSIVSASRVDITAESGPVGAGRTLLETCGGGVGSPLCECNASRETKYLFAFKIDFGAFNAQQMMWRSATDPSPGTWEDRYIYKDAIVTDPITGKLNYDTAADDQDDNEHGVRLNMLYCGGSMDTGTVVKTLPSACAPGANATAINDFTADDAHITVNGDTKTVRVSRVLVKAGNAVSNYGNIDTIKYQYPGDGFPYYTPYGLPKNGIVKNKDISHVTFCFDEATVGGCN